MAVTLHGLSPNEDIAHAYAGAIVTNADLSNPSRGLAAEASSCLFGALVMLHLALRQRPGIGHDPDADLRALVTAALEHVIEGGQAMRTDGKGGVVSSLLRDLERRT